MDDLTQQFEEIEALSAIYGQDFLVIDEASRIYEIRVSHENDCWWSATLQVLLPPQYPSRVPPVFEIHSVWMNEAQRFEASDLLYTIHRENQGQIVLYQWVEGLREFINTKFADYKRNETREPYNKDSSTDGEQKEEMEEKVKHDEICKGLLDEIPGDELEALCISDSELTLVKSSKEKDTSSSPEVVHGEPFTDRKSTFQAHLAHVVTSDQVKQVLEELKSNRKIHNATHNVMAYRIFCEDRNSYLQDCDDDGEAAAGSRLLHLLQILRVKNLVVVVSRWYGGIHLGPDRFKHYNNCARGLLKVGGFVDLNSSDSREAKSKSRLKIKKH